MLRGAIRQGSGKAVIWTGEAPSFLIYPQQRHRPSAGDLAMPIRADVAHSPVGSTDLAGLFFCAPKVSPKAPPVLTQSDPSVQPK